MSAPVEASRIVFSAPLPGSGWWVGVAVAVLAVAFSMWALVQEPSWLRRGLRACLRLMAVGTALWLFLSPSVEHTATEPGPGWMAILLDVSSSMWTRSAASAPTRMQQAQAWLKAFYGNDESAALRSRCRPELFAFGTRLRPLALDAALRLDGAKPAPPLPMPKGVLGMAADAPGSDPNTRTLEALESLLETPTSGSLCGVVVLSDGLDRGALAAGFERLGETDRAQAPNPAAKRISSLALPVHTLALGGRVLRDLSIVEPPNDVLAFVRTPVRIPLELALHGVAPGTRVELQVACEGMAPIRKAATVPLEARTERTRIEVELTPTKTGTVSCEAVLPAMEGEADANNNRQRFLLRTLRDKLRVLQVAGRPSWDVRFLRSLLKSDPNVDLISFYILRTPLDIEVAGPDEMSLIQFPSQRLFEESLPTFDLVILHDFDPGPYGVAPYLHRLATYVVQGGSLILVTRSLEFTAQPEATPLASLLPVERTALDRASSSSSSSLSLSADNEPFHPKRANRSHPVMRLSKEGSENERLWQRLPPLEGYARASAKSQAVVLLTHPSSRNERGELVPILSVMDVGRGRSMALLTETSWRWSSWSSVSAGGNAAAATPKNAETFGADPGVYRTFWRNVFRYLTREAAPDELELELAETAVDENEDIAMTWRLQVAPNVLASRPMLQVRIKPDGTGAQSKDAVYATQARIGEAGTMDVRFSPKQAGVYRAEAEVRLPKGRVAHHGLFRVRSSDREAVVEPPRSDLLAWLSNQTQGEHRTLDGNAVQAAEVHLPRLLQASGPAKVRIDRRPLLSSRWLLLLLGLVVVVEWFLWSRARFRPRQARPVEPQAPGPPRVNPKMAAMAHQNANKPI